LSGGGNQEDVRRQARMESKVEYIAKAVDELRADLRRHAEHTDERLDEIDRRPPQAEQWSDKVKQVGRNAAAIRRIEPQVANHSAALKWVTGVLTAATIAVLATAI
jgi:uncharacterized membrane protein